MRLLLIDFRDNFYRRGSRGRGIGYFGFFVFKVNYFCLIFIFWFLVYFSFSIGFFVIIVIRGFNLFKN